MTETLRIGRRDVEDHPPGQAALPARVGSRSSTLARHYERVAPVMLPYVPVPPARPSRCSRTASTSTASS